MNTIPDALEDARASIRIEQQYIKTDQPNVSRLLDAIDAARGRTPRLEVRIVIAQGFDRETLRLQIEGLAERGLRLGEHVRILNPDHFTHCHNKFIAIDDERFLVGSQNWSDSALTANREAGLLVESRDMCRYFSEVFDADWEGGVRELWFTAVRRVPGAAEQERGFVAISRGDLAEV
jgi:phosphatidylserine/phosphatidylglycerophosphate/cardiolipin synthase-like enzyme